jgi:hypothetical protein
VKDFYIDLLCWSSAFKAVIYSRRVRPGKIYYFNISRFFVPFASFLEKTLKVPVIQVKGIVEGQEKLDGISLYETIQMRLEDLINAWITDEPMAKANAEFAASNGLNPDKFAAHLKEAAYPHLFRPVEMSVVSEHVSGKDGAVFIIRQTPFADLLCRCFDAIVFYRTVFAHAVAIENRTDYFFDKHLNGDYFNGCFKMVGKFLRQWLGDLICSMLFRSTRGEKNPTEVKIGVELTQNRVRLDEINDISWIEGAWIEADQICGLEMETFDEESIKVLNERKIPRYRVGKFSLGSPPDDRVKTIHVALRYSVSSMMMAFGLLKCLVIWNESTWLRFQATRYVYRSLFWMSIYEQIGIKVLWTMYDFDPDKLAKGQAVEWLGGFYTGGHWSNFPMYRVDCQKCFDVLFTWGEHFLKNNFNRFSFMAIFFTGYPCDYYFKMHKERAQAIRQRHEQKFIISYQDNIMANDLPYSKIMQIDIHRILISILNKFENVVVLLKPKRKFLLDEMITELPELAQMIEQGRVEIFLGDTARTKAVSAQIGMASDLVIGLGISTAAAESFFAGTVAFHADFTDFGRNEFANRGEGVIVFKDVFTLENAVIERIKKINKWKYADYKGYYMSLDPFMDGSSNKRMGFLIKRMRDYLAQGINRDELLGKVSKDYDVYLSSMATMQGMNWN